MKIPDRYLELMNGRIDGALSAGEQDELDRYLAGNAHADRYYRELCRAVEIFTRIGPVAAPPGLRDRILAAVGTAGRETPAGDPAREGAPSLGPSLPPDAESAPRRRRWRPGHVLALAAGLALGFVLHAWLSSRFADVQRVDDGLLRGTYVSPDLLHDGRDLAVHSLTGSWGSGEMRPRLLDGDLLVELQLNAERGIRLVLDFDPPTAWTGLHFEERDGYRISSEPGRVVVEGDGQCRGEILFTGFHPGARAIRLRLSADGRDVVDEAIAHEGGA
jgi:hypothetical protein